MKDEGSPHESAYSFVPLKIAACPHQTCLSSHSTPQHIFIGSPNPAREKRINGHPLNRQKIHYNDAHQISEIKMLSFNCRRWDFLYGWVSIVYFFKEFRHRFINGLGRAKSGGMLSTSFNHDTKKICFHLLHAQSIKTKFHGQGDMRS